MMQELNHASQKGMVEMFDNNVGRSTILNAFGGQTMDTPEVCSVKNSRQTDLQMRFLLLHLVTILQFLVGQIITELILR